MCHNQKSVDRQVQEVFKNILENSYCVKGVQIRSYLSSVFSCIQYKYRKIQARNNSVFGHLLRSELFLDGKEILLNDLFLSKLQAAARSPHKKSSFTSIFQWKLYKDGSF